MTQPMQCPRQVGAFLHTRPGAFSLLLIAISCILLQLCSQPSAAAAFGQPKPPMGDLPQYALNLPQSDRDEMTLYAPVSAPAPVTVAITADGTTRRVEAQSDMTVEELLSQEDIAYHVNDTVTPNLDTLLVDTDTVTVQRVELIEQTEQAPIVYDTLYRDTPLLKTGIRQVVQEGMDGLMETTYTQSVIDGVTGEAQITAQTVLRPSIDEVVLLGTGKAVSPLIFDIEVDENANPVNYKRLLENQSSTAYTARPGALTASGQPAQVGMVAVNPNIIPYGTRLYIASADGSFVYGCAIAADTGSALMSGSAGVDLFFDTYDECVQHGRRPVNIYVLD